MKKDFSNQSVLSEDGSWHHANSAERRDVQRRVAHARCDFELDREDRRSGRDRRRNVASWETDQLM